MKGKISKTEQVSWTVVFTFEAFFIVLCNFLALCVFAKRKFLLCRSCYLLINLTVADLLVGISAVFSGYEIISLERSEIKSFMTCENKLFDAFATLFLLFTVASLMSLVLIAIERACSIFMPFRHRVAKTRYYNAGIAFIWLISGIPSVSLLPQCESLPINNKLVTLSLLLILVIPSFVILVSSYVAIYIKLRFFPVFQHNNSTQRQIKLCRTLCIATVTSIIAVLPHNIVLTTLELCTSCTLSVNAVLTTKAFIFGNSFINLAIYALKIPEFWNELKKILCNCFNKGERRQSRVVPGMIPLDTLDTGHP
ncbi:pinopsin-like [Actinia tenebrosa]|uniref:Pinopsin-like n=1 Tax=Actinia tenebrosa TaxID=6105 RepID=A0A6P8IAQ7_ACTTE|nr:pinopsin-like [Actinia tenebrosa]